MRNSKQLFITLKVPVFVESDDDIDNDLLQKYFNDVINEREDLKGAMGQPAKGRYCFNGEFVREALDKLVKPVPHLLKGDKCLDPFNVFCAIGVGNPEKINYPRWDHIDVKVE